MLTLQSMLDEPATGVEVQVWRSCADIVPRRRAVRDRVRASDGAPSSGSKATQKRPAFSSGTMIGSSSSSLTRTEHAPELTRAETKMSFDSTSSFFWSSPLEFWSPAMPKRLAMPALAHAREVALQARPSCAIRIVSCGRKHRALVSRLVCGRAIGRVRTFMSLVLPISHRPSVMKSASFTFSTGWLSTFGIFAARRTVCRVRQGRRPRGRAGCGKGTHEPKRCRGRTRFSSCVPRIGIVLLDQDGAEREKSSPPYRCFLLERKLRLTRAAIVDRLIDRRGCSPCKFSQDGAGRRATPRRCP